jgi:hypothetical protein
MDAVQAKFKCDSITDNGYSKTASFSAVTGTSEENKHFTSLTPSGSVNINIMKDAPASDFFEPQGEYFLTFAKAPKQ